MTFREKYFHVVAIAVSVGFLSGLAGVANATETTATITDHYKTVIDRDPYQVEVCYDVNVPGDKTGDTLKGAIIGGIIGNNVGNVDNGGALGAVIGGMIGHNNSKATGGTKRQCRIETRYDETTREVYSHSTVKFYIDGTAQVLKFYR
jgi:uncharacterized protein YcfJ